VLYTFDDQNKTNCLARWPQVLDIRTVYLDECTQIGVVELKICIQAVVSASPELVAKLGQDYTVYAYDYSEFDTPLVGQGMLSWVLASSSGSTNPALSSRTVVTGRVCRNILGLFSSSSQETLEVKLRLVPVPTCLQSEYIESMKMYRDLSKTIPEGFDAGAWTSFLQANPSVGHLTQPNRHQPPPIGPGQRDLAGQEHVPKFASQGISRRGSVEQRHFSRTESPSATEPPRQLPRAPSPASSARSITAPSKRRGRPPRTTSRTSARGRDIQPALVASRNLVEDLVEHTVENTMGTTVQGTVENTVENIVENTTEAIREPDDDRFEDGPVKKRAKVSRAEWSGSTGFGKQPDSLRVAASTAASVRIYQPTALRPSINSATSLEGPPRAPTPVADPNKIIRRPALPTARSRLQSQSSMTEIVDYRLDYRSPYNKSDTPRKPVGRTMTSPEGGGIGSPPNTPPDIPSSPPVYRGPSTAPSSPHLPTLPAHMDSGFMSGAIDDLFEGVEYRTPDDNNLDAAGQYSKSLELPERANGNLIGHHVSTPASPVVHQSPPDAQSIHQEVRSGSASLEVQGNQDVQLSDLDAKAVARTRKAANNASDSRVIDRTMSSGNHPASPLPTSNPAQATALCRSQSWSGQQESQTVSNTARASQTSESSGKPKQRSRGAGANAKRKKAIQSRLQTSIEAGEMPPFCENCGAIETPTWRKAWVKVHSGKPEHVQISEEEGGIIAWETLQTDVEGNVCLYRIIKRTLLQTDDGFTEILLCNRKPPPVSIS
jgi:hypothetical protein